MFKHYLYPVILNIFYSTLFVGEEDRFPSSNLPSEDRISWLFHGSSLELMVSRLIQALNGLRLRSNQTRTYIRFESEFGPIEEMLDTWSDDQVDQMTVARLLLNEIVRSARFTVLKRSWLYRTIDWVTSNADFILGIVTLVMLYLLFIFTFKMMVTSLLHLFSVSNRKVALSALASVLLLIYQWPLLASIFIQARFMIIYLSLLLNAWLLLKLYHRKKSFLLSSTSSTTEPPVSKSSDLFDSTATANLNNIDDEDETIDEIDYCNESGYLEDQADDTLSVASQTSTLSTTSSSFLVRKLPPICSPSLWTNGKLNNGLHQYNYQLPSIEDELEHQD